MRTSSAIVVSTSALCLLVSSDLGKETFSPAVVRPNDGASTEYGAHGVTWREFGDSTGKFSLVVDTGSAPTGQWIEMISRQGTHWQEERNISPVYGALMVTPYRPPISVLLDPTFRFSLEALRDRTARMLSFEAPDLEKICAAYIQVADWGKSLANTVGEQRGFELREAYSSPLLYHLLQDLGLNSASIELGSCTLFRMSEHSWVGVKLPDEKGRAIRFDLDPAHYPDTVTFLSARGSNALF